MRELKDILEAVDKLYPVDPNASAVELARQNVQRTKEFNKMTRFLDSLQYLSEHDYATEEVIDYDYSTSENLNYMDNEIGLATYRRMVERCIREEERASRLIWEKDGWLDLYDTPTVWRKGRLVQIPLDRPRWADETPSGYSASWKSYEPGSSNIDGATGEMKFLNDSAYDEARIRGLLPEAKKAGMIKTEVQGIERYWVAVGPRVIIPEYSITGKKPQATEMKIGTCMDVILRDSNYNIFFVPTIIGDVKEHTYPNGIYQTGYSWDSTEDEGSWDSDAAIIEFIRKPPVPEDDTLMNTTEFDILGIIVYD